MADAINPRYVAVKKAVELKFRAARVLKADGIVGYPTQEIDDAIHLAESYRHTGKISEDEFQKLSTRIWAVNTELIS